MNIINLLFPPKTPSPPKMRQSRRGVEIKSPAEIEIMRLSGKIVGNVLQEIADMLEPGMTTADLDSYAQKRIEEMGATPSFKGPALSLSKGYHGFPASMSRNDFSY